jgi:hypothetical protein
VNIFVWVMDGRVDGVMGSCGGGVVEREATVKRLVLDCVKISERGSC